MKAFCDAHAVPYETRGKLIVATDAGELPRLAALHERGKANGVEVELLDAAGIREREPAITGVKGLFVPATAIVDYTAVLDALAGELVAKGGEIRLATTPERIRESAKAVEIDCGGGTVVARSLIACAGLQYDRLARTAGLRLSHRVVPFRGEYFRLAPRHSDVVHAMIYPVPDPGLPFLGIHLTPMIDGSVTVGPNAVLALAREGYARGAVSLRDMVDIFSFPGFWRLAARNLRAGADGVASSTLTRLYLEACRRYCPALELQDLERIDPGIRAQAVLADGTMVYDFLFEETPRMLHVCNAPSPAATSALPIGEMIARRVIEKQDG
jgi:L-2-hydroxyglutarate oxidase